MFKQTIDAVIFLVRRMMFSLGYIENVSIENGKINSRTHSNMTSYGIRPIAGFVDRKCIF